MNQWLWLLWGLLAVVAFFFLTLAPEVELGDTPATTVVLDEPDILMENANITQFEADGNREYRLHAKEIRHFDAKNLTRLADPELTMYQQNRPPWIAKSRKGYIRRETAQDGHVEEIVLLREAVELERIQPGIRGVHLGSELMYIYPARQYAESTQPVTIDTTTGRTVAQNMTADFKKGRIHMYSGKNQRVHTIVLPDQFE